LAEASLKGLKVRDITFLCGEVGPLALAAVFFHLSGNKGDSQECISTVISFLPTVTSQSSGLPSELLYGRVGYLYTLLFLQKYIPSSITGDYIKEVSIIVG